MEKKKEVLERVSKAGRQGKAGRKGQNHAVWLFSLIVVEIIQSIEVYGFMLAQSKESGTRFQA